MKQKRTERTNLAALRYVFGAAPFSFLVMALMGLANGGAALLCTLCIRNIFAHIEEGYTSRLALLLAAYAAALLLSAAYSVWYIRYRVQFHTILNFERKIRKKLHEKSRMLSNESLETPNAYAFIRQADGAKTHLFRFGQIYVESATFILQALMITAYVSSFHIWFLLFLPFAVLPTLTEMLYQARLWQRDYETITQCKREETAYETAIAGDACKETRLTGAESLLLARRAASRAQRDALESTKSKKMCALRLGLGIFSCAGNIGGFVVSLLLYRFGEIDFAAFSAGIAAYASLAAVLSGLVGTFGNEAQYRQMIRPYFRYLDMTERGGEEKDCTFEREIALKGVSFSYPNQEGNALQDVDLTVRRGEIVAIVGENGAGKSTLANVILGLYRPDSGTVTYDGKDISSAREEIVHKRQSVVLQHFVKYQTTIGDNIAVADLSKRDEPRIRKEVLAIFSGQPCTSETRVGKEFGGRELSGGEWQRLAVARGFYKDADFFVLDEPTSAIDPLREKEICERFRAGLKGKTGLIVTHRLSAARLADRIVVLKGGRIVESGTHEALLRQNGAYRTFWNAQAAAFESTAEG